MPVICSECGAIHFNSENVPVVDGVAACQAIFEEFLILEFTDPSFGEVHFLTVTCFMIQHGRYSDEGFAWIAEKLQQNIEDGIAPDQIRRQASRETGQDKRTWKVTRPPGARPLPKIHWSMTISDVVDGYRSAQSSADACSSSVAVVYCELIRRWARVTLREMKPFLKNSLS